MTLKAVLFDLDDTLYAYEPCNRAGLRAAWQLLSRSVEGLDFEEFAAVHDEVRDGLAVDLAGSAASHNRALFFKEIAEHFEAPAPGSLAVDLYDCYWQRFYDEMPPRAAAHRVLAELIQRGYLLALVSNHTTLPQLRKVRRLGLESCFRAIVTSEEAGVEKPAPRIFELALDKLELRAAEAAFVGDNPRGDIGGAAGAGIAPTILTTEYVPSASSDEADHTVTALADILEILP